ncbi:diguanylate cyclase domain-containing protein [Microbacteriaceae bacterium 4G12]
MTTPPIPVTAAERIRLENCSREPIRRPGLVQPHGVLLTVLLDTWAVAQVSVSCAAVLGQQPDELIGRPLTDVVGGETVDALSAALTGRNGAANPVPVEVGGRRFDGIVHFADGVVVLELEPELPAEEFATPSMVYAAVNRLATLRSREELWADAAHELAMLTGFDRVMIYHFHPDAHGQVVAEVRADDSMEPYLGLHYPASDIPAQARELYLAKLSRTIFSTEDAPEPLVPEQSPATGEPLDLSSAELRSVSPHHLQFMRNMGQASTLSFSLIFNGELIGMITCAHRTPRRLPYTLRRGLEVFSNQVALQLSAMSEIARLTRDAELSALRTHLVGQFTSDDDTVQSLLHGEVTLLDLVPAAGAALSSNGILSTVGSAPELPRIDLLLEHLRSSDRLPFASESLPQEHPDLVPIVPSVAGAVVVPFGGQGDYLAWFRPEITETTRWLGDQSESNRDSILSPRNSFSSWSASVSGRAEPWRGLEVAAIELGRDLDSALMRQAESALAHLGMHDALTGLPNRRLFTERLQRALSGDPRGGHVAVIFIDIDSFKAINDSQGHGGGDTVLQQIAERISSATRASDTLARLGGDEFVVLCENTGPDGARKTAERVLEALLNPLDIAGRPLKVTASIGVATATHADTPDSLLGRADSAMYRAKRSGKDRVSD